MGLKDFFNSKKPIKVGSPLTSMGDFPLVNAHDVIVDYDDETKTETRLDDKLKNIVLVDKTLTQPDQAADAQAVGNRITNTVGNIENVLKRL